MINGGLLGAVVWTLLQQDDQSLPMPFSLDSMKVYARFDRRMMVHIRSVQEGSKLSLEGGVRKYNLSFMDLAGNRVAQMENLSLVFPKQQTRDDNNPLGRSQPMRTMGSIQAAKFWLDEEVTQDFTDVVHLNPMFILATKNEELQGSIEAMMPSARIEYLPSLTSLSKSKNSLETDLHWMLDVLQETNPQINKGGEILFLVPEHLYSAQFAAVVAFLKTAKLESPGRMVKAIRFIESSKEGRAALLSGVSKELLSSNGNVEIRFSENGIRSARKLSEVSLPTFSNTTPLGQGKVVWITGALGGIGKLVSDHFANPGVKLVLTGRSELAGRSKQFIRSLENKGAEVSYLQGDVSQEQDVVRILGQIISDHGELNGIIHSAGVIRDHYIQQKTPGEICEVLKPKVDAVQAMDNASSGLSLDFFIMFSSIAGVLGNPGQSDYAAASAFLDEFAAQRNRLQEEGKRRGKTISINWPLWKDGGMNMGGANETLMFDATGMAAMPGEDGLRSLDQWLQHCVDYPHDQILVAWGDKQAIKRKLLSYDYPPVSGSSVDGSASRPSEHTPDIAAPSGVESVSSYIESLHGELIRIVGEVQKIPLNKISLKRALSSYGFDSISFTELTNEINKSLKISLMPTVFFEIQDLLALSDYLLAHHQDVLQKKYPLASDHPGRGATTGNNGNAGGDVVTETLYESSESPNILKTKMFNLLNREMPSAAVDVLPNAPRPISSSAITKNSSSESLPKAVAIIGMAGKFPGGGDLDRFWTALVNNEDLISEVPEDRWNWRDYYGDPNSEPGKTKVKWGGFIEDADRFDPLFFGISPLEAESMDPQLRLFLETVWATIEDAGYSASSLSGSDTGVFAGVATADYKDLWHEAKLKKIVTVPAEPFPFMVANRVSYVFNFHGPSEVIDTACSSSLIAINRAIESIRHGSCDGAIAGGVNVMASPKITIASSQAGMLSENGRCMTFDKRANGYVRSEGVGAIFLKSLDKAIEDGDRIYGVIRANGENHGGRAASPTAPNAAAQKALLVNIYDRFNIDPRSVSYIEAHGTGTELGDPVEFNGLKGAFETLYRRRDIEQPDEPHCGISSVKANIGHLEAAAGVTGVIKVLLMLRHRMMPGNVHLTEMNPYLEPKGTPFYFLRESRQWLPRKISQNISHSICKDTPDVPGKTDGHDDQGPFPLRAGVSSFGVGGSNAHLVIEEYLADPHSSSNNEPEITDEIDAHPSIIIVSAKSLEALKLHCRNLANFLATRYSGSLAALAYTLQKGRDEMPHRLSFSASSLSDAKDILEKFGHDEECSCFHGEVANDGSLSALTDDEDMLDVIRVWVEKGKTDKLAQAWVNGVSVDWEALIVGKVPGKVALPTYPFARERYWIPEADDNDQGEKRENLSSQSVFDTKPETISSEGMAQRPDSELIAKSTSAAGDKEILLFEEVWEQEALDVPFPGVKFDHVICFISQSDDQEAISRALGKYRQDGSSPQVSFVAKLENGSPEKLILDSGRVTTVDAADSQSFRKALEYHKEQRGDFDAVLYLWPWEDSDCIYNASVIVRLLQSANACSQSLKKLILSARTETGLQRAYVESWIGFERSLQMVSNIRVSVVFEQTNEPVSNNSGINNSGINELVNALSQRESSSMGFNGMDSSAWFDCLALELFHPQGGSACYQKGTRHVSRIQSVSRTETMDGNRLSRQFNNIRQGGCYLITGGAGGIGFIVAQHLAKRFNAKLGLTGRSSHSPEIVLQLERLKELGGEAIYVEGNVSDTGQMKRVVESIDNRFGKLDGVIHVAGVPGSPNILDVDIDAFESVLEAKIQGSLVLETVTKEQDLDFICYFSSSSAVLGDFGSCNYAVGNRFQTIYGKSRKEIHGEGVCDSIVINWPLWESGGKSIGGDDQSRLYLESSGQKMLDTDTALMLLDEFLGKPFVQNFVMLGDQKRIQRTLNQVTRPTTYVQQGAASQPAYGLSSSVTLSSAGKGWRGEMEGLDTIQCLTWDLRQLIHSMLKIDRKRLDGKTNLADFGFDSILLAEFARVMTQHFEVNITPSVFFSYSTITQLASYLSKDFRGEMELFYQPRKSEPVLEVALDSPQPKEIVDLSSAPQTITLEQDYQKQPHQEQSENTALGESNHRYQIAMHSDEPIAIIGMSGRFPNARNVDELWEILANSVDAVGEVPKSRFDWSSIYADDENPNNGSISKWGGCIPGIAEFDPLFFEISPLEAERMDPQQRHLLQESWKALEDAGYGENQIAGNKIGMFVGVEEGSDYQRRLKDISLTSSHNGILASRLAYFLNLKGPTMAINTACSSSLVAVHQACLSLRSSECDTAIAAGVNLLVSPDAYVGMSQAGMLSPNGKCYVFDQRADGMVPGEAVAVVVLKRLSKAEQDGDPIHAVIRGSGVNYDGKTNGITAPSGASQTELLNDVYSRADVAVKDIEYIVTHGTATQLGDPVEINALYDAFTRKTDQTGFCALTSTKSNFGHTFAASGLLSMMSLVKSIQHQQIPASINCDQENDYIQWERSPFYVNKQLKPWFRDPESPRLGGVSAFGMSGTNAHVLVEEYRSGDSVKGRVAPQIEQPESPYYLLAFSAMTQDALNQKILDMETFLGSQELENHDLAKISYTLLDGRYHFNYRFAVVVKSIRDAIVSLQAATAGEKRYNLFHGQVDIEFSGQVAIKRYVKDLLRQSQTLIDCGNEFQEALFALGDFYCQGYDLSGDLLHLNAPEKLRLPGYPFSNKEYWIEFEESLTTIVEQPSEAKIHPLLHTNVSLLNKSIFFSRFTGNESFLYCQKNESDEIIPGLHYVEMARVAGETALGKTVSGLSNLVWGAPGSVVDSDRSCGVTLAFHGSEPDLGYSIAYEDEEKQINHIGRLQTRDAGEVLPEVDIAMLQAGLSPVNVSNYDLNIETRGEVDALSVSELFVSPNMVLAKSGFAGINGDVTKDGPFKDIEPTLFHPANLHMVWKLLRSMSPQGQRLLPMSLKHIQIFQALPQFYYTCIKSHTQMGLQHARGVASRKYNVMFYDKNGVPIGYLKEFSIGPMERLFNIKL